MEEKENELVASTIQASASDLSDDGPARAPATQDDAITATVTTEPPDGGLTAWLQVVGSWCLYFNTWGILNTFGVYQSYYEAVLLSDMSASSISWIGSVQSFLLLFVGVVGGPIYDRGYLREQLVAGAVLVVFGTMMTSIATRYWQIMLAQALCTGTGSGLLLIPSMALVPQYFRRRKALAMGMAVTGSSIGGVLYSLVFQQLQPRVGFGWSMRVLAFCSLATLVVAVATLRRREPPPRERRTLLEWAAFRERPYALYCSAMVLSNVAFFTPVFYVQAYALQHGMAGSSLALYLISIMNACSVLGRLAPSLVAPFLGPAQTMFLSILGTGITTYGWIATDSEWGNIVFAGFFGFFSGGIVALPAVVLTSFTPDLSRLGTRLGMSSMLNALGSLIGAPIGGAILAAGPRLPNWVGMQVYVGTVVMLTAACFAALRVSLIGWRVPGKA
ncbi:major facilitator superfamily domain-containing protein [Xylariales sp. PMI_506]|nr:major facilitator superfamily domain-containing protein [Xylariales sp. PMI_506]